MIIHMGKREEEESCTLGPWLLYIVCGEMELEACLLEVDVQLHSLRSRGSFVLINRETGDIFIWHGCKSKPYTRKVAAAAVKRMIKVYVI